MPPEKRRAGVALGKLALFALGLTAGVPQGAPRASAEAPAGPACTLHVWGANRDFSSNPKLAGVAAWRGTASADRSNPLAAINVLDPVQRAGDLEDRELAKLLPNPAGVTVVRHPAFAEVGRAKGSDTPLHPLETGCSADLVVADVYDVEVRNKKETAGVLAGALTDLLMAPSGWHATYILRVFDPRGKLVWKEKESMMAPLRLLRSDWSRDPDAAVAAIREAMRASLTIMRQRLVKHGHLAATPCASGPC